MSRRIAAIMMLVAIAAPLAGCVVYSPPPPHYGAHWVPGHYDRWGRWVPGHWT